MTPEETTTKALQELATESLVTGLFRLNDDRFKIGYRRALENVAKRFTVLPKGNASVRE